MLELFTFLIAGLGLALSVGSETMNRNISSTGSRLRTELGKVAKDLSNKMNKNSNLLSQVYQAYLTKNNNLLNRIFTGMGFGPRMQNLVQAAEANEKDYTDTLKQLNQENADIEKQLNEINTAINNTGTSYAGNEAAQRTLDKYNNLSIEKQEDKENLKQNVQGGIQ